MQLMAVCCGVRPGFRSDLCPAKEKSLAVRHSGWSWKYSLGYNDTRNCSHGCTCRPKGAKACPVRPHSRQRNACRHNPGRYAALPFLYISVTNNCSLSVFFNFSIDYLAVPSCPTVPVYEAWDNGTPWDTSENAAFSCLVLLLFLSCKLFRLLFLHDCTGCPALSRCPTSCGLGRWDTRDGRFPVLLTALDYPADGGFAAIHL